MIFLKINVLCWVLTAVIKTRGKFVKRCIRHFQTKEKLIINHSSPRLPLSRSLDNVDKLDDGLGRLDPLAFFLIVR